MVKYIQVLTENNIKIFFRLYSILLPSIPVLLLCKVPQVYTQGLLTMKTILFLLLKITEEKRPYI